MTDSALGRLLGVLIAPVKTFESIAARPTWAAPLLVLVALTAFVSYQISQRMDFEQVVRQQAERAEQRGNAMSPEQMDRMIEMYKKVQPFFAVLQMVVAPVIYLAMALVFWLAFRFVGGANNFLVSFSVVLHALMPAAVAALIAIPLLQSHGTLTAEEVERGSLLVSNLAVLAPARTGPVALALLGSIDVFSLWTLALLAIGFRAAAKTSKAMTGAVTAVLWLLYVAGKVGFVALFRR
ncbi:MAG TPA: YIP1 family protein [Thermoanaerobaculia bacterium]|nr:YIP1 family protein [Thermoanaerobaculia bacterium]